MLTGEAARLSCAKAFMSFIVSIEVIKDIKSKVNRLSKTVNRRVSRVALR